MFPPFPAPMMAASQPHDPYLANVEFLFHFDGTDGSTTVVDARGKHTPTVTGTTALRTAGAKFGSAGLQPVSGGAIVTDFPAIGTQDFTLEAFVYKGVNAGAIQQIFGNLFSAVGNFGLRWSSTEALQLVEGNGAGQGLVGTQVASDTTIGVFRHIAVSRAAGTVYLFINGVQKMSGAWATSLVSMTNFGIGCGNTTSNPMQSGYVDEARLTIGVGRYTASFTPPSRAFPSH